jgi:glycosyltransferase involved in cell wall biosynthesis
MKVLVVSDGYPTPEAPGVATVIRDQVESLRREGIDVDVFLVHGGDNKINYLLGIFRLWKHLLTHRYDLIHAHYVFEGIVARTQFLYPVVLTQHGSEVFTTWERFPCRMINHFVDKVILVSQEQKDKLGYDKAVVIPCGTDFDRFKPMPHEEARKKLGLPLEKKLVLWAVQGLRPEKRLDIVEAAVGLSHEKDPLIELVPLTGKPHDTVAVYMNACDALLLVSDGEGSPMVVKEALACNLPVVGYPTGDMRDLIGDVDGCYLCSQDPADVAEKLLLALNGSRLTDGRERTGQMELSNIAKRIVTVYQEVLDKKKRSLLFRLSRRLLAPKA